VAGKPDTEQTVLESAQLVEMAAALKVASQAKAAAEEKLQAQLQQQEAAVAAATAAAAANEEPSRRVLPDRSEHPVVRTLESHQLEEHFDKLLEMGVKRVEDLEQMNQEEISALGMNRFDRNKFQAAFVTETPHHGGGSSTSKDSTAMPLTAGGFTFEDNKHAMLSYQWDSQETVLKVRDHFAQRGIPTWMDVDGGMAGDIYDSMAAGVSNAAVVVAFLSQRYQDSENCQVSAYAIAPICIHLPLDWSPAFYFPVWAHV
jgi:hypothetical protein